METSKRLKPKKQTPDPKHQIASRFSIHHRSGTYIWNADDPHSARLDGPTMILIDGAETYFLNVPKKGKPQPESMFAIKISIRDDGNVDTFPAKTGMWTP